MRNREESVPEFVPRQRWRVSDRRLCTEWTELELFETLVDRESDEAFQELRTRIERCVRWHFGRGGENEIQEVCDRVREKLEALRRRGFSGDSKAFRVYLYRVVASQVAEVQRDGAWLLPLDAVVELPTGGTKTLRDMIAEMADFDRDALDKLDTRQEQGLLRRALARLDERCRRLLLEREVQRRPELEIAERFGLTVSNVGVSLHRCRQRLYRLLLAVRCASLDQDWERIVTGLGERLAEPSRTVFRLWWSEHCPIRDIASYLGRREPEVKDLLARAKAGVWRLAQESAG